MDEKSQVREPREINARLALKFQHHQKCAEQRELLLPELVVRPGARVALRDADRYHQFRETLKNLLTLSAIAQNRDRPAGSLKLFRRPEQHLTHRKVLERTMTGSAVPRREKLF